MRRQGRKWGVVEKVGEKIEDWEKEGEKFVESLCQEQPKVENSSPRYK